MTKTQHEQDYETARAGIDCTDPYACASAVGALYRLKEEAAKVPGLEAQAQADWVALCIHLGWACERRVGLPAPNRAVCEIIGRLHTAESERDAARQETGVERTLKQEHADRAERLALSNETLRERVATLEGRLDAMRDSRDRAEQATDRQRQRADTAEARVKELAEKIAGARNAALEEAALLCMEVCQNKVTGAVLARLFREKKSQPPPAPAQAGEDRNHRGENLDEVCGKCGHTRREHADGPCMWVVPVDDDLRACGCGPFVLREQAPTPPALVEAVGEVLKMAGSTWTRPPMHPWLRAVKRLRAAYEAAKGGASLVHCPGCKQMAPAEQMHTRCTMCAAYEDERLRQSTLEDSEDAEDAAKYRAAVERLAHERKAGAEASHWDYAHVILTGDVPNGGGK